MPEEHDESLGLGIEDQDFEADRGLALDDENSLAVGESDFLEHHDHPRGNPIE